MDWFSLKKDGQCMQQLNNHFGVVKACSPVEYPIRWNELRQKSAIRKLLYVCHDPNRDVASNENRQVISSSFNILTLLGHTC